VQLGFSDLEVMLSADNYPPVHEQFPGTVFGSMDDLRTRVTEQRASTATELREGRVVAPRLMNEHNPDTLEPLGFLTEHHGDTRAIRFVDGRVGKGLPTLLSDVANWPDMMVITDVGGHSEPTKREVSLPGRPMPVTLRDCRANTD
jgi:hypothetical protein